MDLPAGSQDRMIPLAADVSDTDSVVSALKELADRTGDFHALVNNAGIHKQGPSATFPLADFNEVLSVNATAVLAACQAAYPHLRRAGGGVIVNIGSHYDKIGVKQHAAYCASKAAVGAITRCLAVEWARDASGSSTSRQGSH